MAACIPSKANRKTPIPHDKLLYRQRHKIENMFGKLKDWRRIHTRYDRCAHTFMSAICIAATVIFLAQSMSPEPRGRGGGGGGLSLLVRAGSVSVERNSMPYVYVEMAEHCGGRRKTGAYMAENLNPTPQLIDARTEGLKVLSRDGDGMGHVHALMVVKRTGQATFAVLSLGGILGLGKSYYPVPFGLLSYDTVHDKYIVTADRRLLEGGPSWSNNAPTFDQAYADRVSSYYDTASVSVV